LIAKENEPQIAYLKEMKLVIGRKFTATPLLAMRNNFKINRFPVKVTSQKIGD